MIPQIVKQWDKNKSLLEDYFRKTPQEQYRDYEDIVRLLFQIVINDEDTTIGSCYDNLVFNFGKMTIVDDGEYQGTRIFLIPLEVYQPDETQYIVTDTYYGSCSGCDTIQSIHSYQDGLPSESQIKEYMTLALHLVQKMKWLNSKGE